MMRHFCAKSAAKMGIAAPDIDLSSIERIMTYSWPGNVRELENLVERAITLEPRSNGLFKAENGLRAWVWKACPETLESITESLGKFQQTLKIWHELGKDKRYAISDAYKASYLKGGINNHYGGVVEDPLEINVNTGRTVPPEEWDFRGIWRKEPLTFRTLGSKIVVSLAHNSILCPKSSYCVSNG